MYLRLSTSLKHRGGHSPACQRASPPSSAPSEADADVGPSHEEPSLRLRQRVQRDSSSPHAPRLRIPDRYAMGNASQAKRADRAFSPQFTAQQLGSHAAPCGSANPVMPQPNCPTVISAARSVQGEPDQGRRVTAANVPSPSARSEVSATTADPSEADRWDRRPSPCAADPVPSARARG